MTYKNCEIISYNLEYDISISSFNYNVNAFKSSNCFFIEFSKMESPLELGSNFLTSENYKSTGRDYTYNYADN